MFLGQSKKIDSMNFEELLNLFLKNNQDSIVAVQNLLKTLKKKEYESLYLLMSKYAEMVDHSVSIEKKISAIGPQKIEEGLRNKVIDSSSTLQSLMREFVIRLKVEEKTSEILRGLLKDTVLGEHERMFGYNEDGSKPSIDVMAQNMQPISIVSKV